MKAILITDKPKWCRLMMNGDKTVEARKGDKLYKATQKLIDEYGYAEFYVCCSKAKHIKDYLQIENGKYVCNVPKDYESELNGKVAFKFRCYKVSDFSKGELIYYKNDGWCGTEVEHINTNGMCLSEEELHNYLKGKTGCAIHISDLEIFDKPKELSEFQGFCNSCAAFRVCKLNRELCNKSIKKAPQSFCYVETGGYNNGSK